MKILTIQTVVMTVAALGLAGCVGGDKTGVSSDEQAQREVMSPHGGRVDFEWLLPPEGVGAQNMEIQTLSANGQVLVGTAMQQANVAGQAMPHAQKFRWDLTSHQWLWLKGSGAAGDIRTNASASTIWGNHWVWQHDTGAIHHLGSQFWAHVVRGDGQVLGIGSGGYFVLRSLDGQHIQQWPASDILQLDNQGHVQEKFWFAGNGVLVSTTLNACVLSSNCQQASITRWTPEQGQAVVDAQMPQRDDEFIQSNPGPCVISDNGQWLAGAVGRRIYMWDAQGRVKQLGGYEQGGTVQGISDDGRVVTGSAVDTTSLQGSRAWIWTDTEGQNWLDEWLLNYGSDTAQTHHLIEVKFISADRRVIVGTAQRKGDEGQTKGVEGIVWWRARLPEKLRVLVN